MPCGMDRGGSSPKSSSPVDRMHAYAHPKRLQCFAHRLPSSLRGAGCVRRSGRCPCRECSACTCPWLVAGACVPASPATPCARCSHNKKLSWAELTVSGPALWGCLACLGCTLPRNLPRMQAASWDTVMYGVPLQLEVTVLVETLECRPRQSSHLWHGGAAWCLQPCAAAVCLHSAGRGHLPAAIHRWKQLAFPLHVHWAHPAPPRVLVPHKLTPSLRRPTSVPGRPGQPCLSPQRRTFRRWSWRPSRGAADESATCPPCSPPPSWVTGAAPWLASLWPSAEPSPGANRPVMGLFEHVYPAPGARHSAGL